MTRSQRKGPFSEVKSSKNLPQYSIISSFKPEESDLSVQDKGRVDEIQRKKPDSEGVSPDPEFLEGGSQKVWSRRSLVLPEHLGSLFLIHNGKTFIRFKPVEESIGHKFGEFSLTRRMGSHKKKKKQAARRK